jgi:hypothetical protein
MSYNSAEFNYFPFGFGSDYESKQKGRGMHPIYHLKVGQTYTSTSSKDYRDCFNRTSFLRTRGIELKCKNGIFTRVK